MSTGGGHVVPCGSTYSVHAAGAAAAAVLDTMEKSI